MGWTSELDTRKQIRLRFETLEQALDFARQHELEVDIESAHSSRAVRRSYADNFIYNRLIPWSH